jgi:hypothetical protein
MNDIGIIYILTNPAMPGLVKIGKTFRGSTEARMVELYSSGVPVPFDCVYAAKVNNAEMVEKALHTAFGPYRINPKREFFEIEADQAIVVLRLLALENATPQIEKESEQIDETSREAGERLRRSRPALNFIEMGIPTGSILESIECDETATVATERTVNFRNEIVSLTRATRMVLGNDYDVAPTPHWTYNGRILQEIYNETYRPQE